VSISRLGTCFGGLGKNRAAVAGTIDPYWYNTVLLASFDGTNGATTFNDESPAARGAATFFGGAALSNTHSKFGATSLKTLNTVSPGGVSWPDSADWQFGTGPWTVEAFVWVANVGGGVSMFVGHWDHAVSNAWRLYCNAGNMNWGVSTTGTDSLNDVTFSPGVSIDTLFRHYAVCFDGVKTRFFFDGVMRGSNLTIRTYRDANATLSIGMDSDNSIQQADAWFSEVRVTKAARYASDTTFTPPIVKFPRG
jgi:hypothetical protein